MQCSCELEFCLEMDLNLGSRCDLTFRFLLEYDTHTSSSYARVRSFSPPKSQTDEWTMKRHNKPLASQDVTEEI
jgi:hypothetical protein